MLGVKLRLTKQIAEWPRGGPPTDQLRHCLQHRTDHSQRQGGLLRLFPSTSLAPSIS